MIINWDAGVLVIILLALIIWNYFKTKKECEKKVKEYKRKHDRMLSLKKSSEIRVGKIGENMAPFLKAWPYDPNNFRFLGNPVDGIQFTNKEIIFIEIKTGKSKLTKSQKRTRDIVRKGNISFATFRVDESGTELRKETHVKDNKFNVEIV